MMKPTLHDVAKMAGVSIATVSHVINDTRKVSSGTRDRVMKAIDCLGYQQNISARELRMGINYTIGFIVPDITNIFYATLVQRVSDYCIKRGYSLIFMNTFEQLRQEQAHLKMLGNHSLGGLIIASTAERYGDIEDVVPHVPILFFDREVQDCPYECIRINSYQAYYDAALDMIKKGHRRIGYLAGLQRISTSQERLRGFMDGLDSVGFPAQDRIVCICDSISSVTVQETYRLLDEGCTAIIASNRSMLLSATFALISKGIRISEDIQLVGSTENMPILPFVEKINSISQPINYAADFLSESIIRKIEHPEERLHIPSFYAEYKSI